MCLGLSGGLWPSQEAAGAYEAPGRGEEAPGQQRAGAPNALAATSLPGCARRAIRAPPKAGGRSVGSARLGDRDRVHEELQIFVSGNEDRINGRINDIMTLII